MNTFAWIIWIFLSQLFHNLNQPTTCSTHSRLTVTLNGLGTVGCDMNAAAPLCKWLLEEVPDWARCKEKKVHRVTSRWPNQQAIIDCGAFIDGWRKSQIPAFFFPPHLEAPFRASFTAMSVYTSVCVFIKTPCRTHSHAHTHARRQCGFISCRVHFGSESNESTHHSYINRPGQRRFLLCFLHHSHSWGEEYSEYWPFSF